MIHESSPYDGMRKRIVGAFMAIVDEDNKVTTHLYLPSKTKDLKFWFKVNEIAFDLSD